VDLQHGQISSADLHHMLPAISATPSLPFVRVSWNDPAEIMKALDAGAYGVIVPMVNTAAEAQQAVAACRYPPDGNRSFGPIRAALYGGSGYARHANQEMACVAMIETQAALDNLDAILGVPGLDAIYVGPSDLGLARGRSPIGDTDDPAHVQDVMHILARAQAHGVTAGIHTGSLAFAQRWLEAGFQMITLGIDSGFMARAASADLRAIRARMDELASAEG
jgi:4-hydroxy-2-oxoheptanedioate aldolase